MSALENFVRKSIFDFFFSFEFRVLRFSGGVFRRMLNFKLKCQLNELKSWLKNYYPAKIAAYKSSENIENLSNIITFPTY